MSKCEKFVLRCNSKKQGHAISHPSAQSNPGKPISSQQQTTLTVVVLDSDDDECAVEAEGSKTNVKKPSPEVLKPSKKTNNSSESTLEAVQNIADMEILSLIDELSQRNKATNPVENGISLVSSEESDSNIAESSNEGNEDDKYFKDKRKANKLRKRENKKREKLSALKKELNKKDKCIEELKKKIVQDQQVSIESEKETTDSDRPVEAVASTSSKKAKIDVNKSSESSSATGYVVEPLTLNIKQDIDDDGVYFTRRPKKEPKTPSDVAQIINTASTSSASVLLQTLNNLLVNEVGVNMNEFLQIMKTDKYEIKKEIISKALHPEEEPPPPPQFPKVINKAPINETSLQSPQVNPRDPRISQDSNPVLARSPVPSLMNNMNILAHPPPPFAQNMVPTSPLINHNHVLNRPQNYVNVPSALPIRDPRLLRQAPNVIPNVPSIRSPEYSAREEIPRPNVNVLLPNLDKRNAMNYREYKLRRELEDQQKKQLLKSTLNVVESINTVEAPQLKEKPKPLLESKKLESNQAQPVTKTVLTDSTKSRLEKNVDQPKISESSKLKVKKVLSEPVIEYVNPSQDHDVDKSSDGVVDDDDEFIDEMDEITKLNTLRNREIQNIKDLQQVEEAISNNEKENIPSLEKQTATTSVRDAKSEEAKLMQRPKNYREVIRLNMDIVQSFMPNDVLQEDYNAQRPRIMTRRNTMLTKTEVFPPSKITKRRKSSYVSKKELKKNVKKNDQTKEVKSVKINDENDKNKKEDGSWQVEQKSKINLVLRRRGKFFLFTFIYCT